MGTFLGNLRELTMFESLSEPPRAQVGIVIDLTNIYITRLEDMSEKVKSTAARPVEHSVLSI